MYKLTVFQFTKPVGDPDNEAEQVDQEEFSEGYGGTDDLLSEVHRSLSQLGGTHGKWIEVTRIEPSTKK